MTEITLQVYLGVLELMGCEPCLGYDDLETEKEFGLKARNFKWHLWFVYKEQFFNFWNKDLEGFRKMLQQWFEMHPPEKRGIKWGEGF